MVPEGPRRSYKVPECQKGPRRSKVSFYNLLGPSWTFSNFFGPSRTYYDLLGPSGTFFNFLGPFGTLQDLIGHSRTFYGLLGPSGIFIGIRFGAELPNGHFSIAEAVFARLCLNKFSLISTPPPSILIERIYQVNTSHEFIFITILDVDLQCSISQNHILGLLQYYLYLCI